MDNKWMTMEEICEYLKVRRETVLKWIKNNNLPAHKAGRLWRFDITEIDDWIKLDQSAKPKKSKGE